MPSKSTLMALGATAAVSLIVAYLANNGKLKAVGIPGVEK